MESLFSGIGDLSRSYNTGRHCENDPQTATNRERQIRYDQTIKFPSRITPQLFNAAIQSTVTACINYYNASFVMCTLSELAVANEFPANIKYNVSCISIKCSTRLIARRILSSDMWTNRTFFYYIFRREYSHFTIIG